MFRLKLIPYDTKFDIIGKTKLFLSLAFILICICVFSIAKNGLHYGVDFKGGYIFEVVSAKGITSEKIMDKLCRGGVNSASIQRFGKNNEYVITIERSDNNDDPQEMISRIHNILKNDVVFNKNDVVGAKVGRELISSAIKSVLFALIAMIIYIFFRFEWRFSLCAIFALLHDCALIFGVFSMFKSMEFNEVSITAILLTAAYSINDTVVIFDRVRDNLKKGFGSDMKAIINASLNETLSRTALTATTTFLSVLALYLFGGKVIANFALPIMIGLLIGTFSSIFVACPLLSCLNIKPKMIVMEEKPIAQI